MQSGHAVASSEPGGQGHGERPWKKRNGKRRNGCEPGEKKREWRKGNRRKERRKLPGAGGLRPKHGRQFGRQPPRRDRKGERKFRRPEVRLARTGKELRSKSGIRGMKSRRSETKPARKGHWRGNGHGVKGGL